METNTAQIVLLVELKSKTLLECLKEARQVSEGIADSAGAMIGVTNVIHHPSGSGEAIWFDLNGNEITRG